MITFEKCKYFKGELGLPPDKSITHRAIIMSAMADDVSVINRPLLSRDTMATIEAFQKTGVDIANEKSRLLIRSDGYKNFKEPKDIIDCGNSGTTARLLTGVFAPSGFYAVLTGDPSLRRRPMGRVIKPLTTMGASIRARGNDSLLPLTITPAVMKGTLIEMEAKSAQVKSAALLAAIQIEGETTTYRETVATRDHTERMLAAYGADISIKGMDISVKGGRPLKGLRWDVPGDFSSAAFFMAAGLIFEGSDIYIPQCGLNPSRTGLLEALKDLGANVEYDITKKDGEPAGDIRVTSGEINGGQISGAIISNLIDEAPVLALLGLFARSPLEIRDAAELRVKESDRIAALAENFRSLGAEIEEYPDGLKIHPLKSPPEKAVLKSFDDHRICMINILLAKKFGVKVWIDDISPLDVSFPNFIDKILELEVR